MAAPAKLSAPGALRRVGMWPARQATPSLATKADGISLQTGQHLGLGRRNTARDLEQECRGGIQAQLVAPDIGAVPAIPMKDRAFSQERSSIAA